MVQLVWLLLLGHVDAASLQAYKDSALIYNIYKNEIEILAKVPNYIAWRQREYCDAIITEKALKRLERFNGTPYEPIDTSNRESIGTAYLYPQPAGVMNGEDIDTARLQFSVLLPQTRFITDLNGMTRIPFIIRVYYDQNGDQKYAELLDPVTCELLK